MSFPRRVRVPRPSSFFLSIDCRSSVYCRVGVMHIANTRFSLSRSIPRSRFVVQHALQLFAQYPFRVNVAGKVKLLNGRTEGCRYQAHARRIEESFERKWWACNYELCGDSLENSRGPMNKEKKALLSNQTWFDVTIYDVLSLHTCWRIFSWTGCVLLGIIVVPIRERIYLNC